MNETIDLTEAIRRELQQKLNAAASGQPQQTERERLEAEHGQGNVWDTRELSSEFEIVGFMAPIAVVKRRRDGVTGSVMFQHDPRFYFGFAEDK